MKTDMVFDIEEFAIYVGSDNHISLNKDSDLYPGVQQGNNRQVRTLAGVNFYSEDAGNIITGPVL